jgi:hypothetical protein
MVMVVMATRQRQLEFPHIAVVRQQQWDLEAPKLLKVIVFCRGWRVGGGGG